MPPPSRLAVTYATDEDVVAEAGADFRELCPNSFKFAYGKDGAFSPSDLWTLTSATVNFAGQGVRPNMIAQLRGPTSAFKGSGELLAVESVGSGSVTLRRIGEATGVGQPPSPASGLTGVEFLVTSLHSQLDAASRKLNEQFSMDPALPGRQPGDAYDLSVIRTATIYLVLARRYNDMVRTDRGDFTEKAKFYMQAYRDEIDSATIRWGASGRAQPPTSHFGMKLTR